MPDSRIPILKSLLAGLAVCGAFSSCGKSRENRESPPLSLAGQAEALEQTAFKDEVEARRFENAGFVPLWDQLNAASPPGRMVLMAGLPLDTVQTGTGGAEEQRPYGVTVRTFLAGAEPGMDRPAWRSWVEGFVADGWVITHTDWHQASFQRDARGTARSGIRFTVQATRGDGEAAPRAEIKGLVNVTWRETGGHIQPASAAVEKVTVSRREGAPPFALRAVLEGKRGTAGQRMDMGAVAVCDLDADGLPEIILGNANRILWNTGKFGFEPHPLVPRGGEYHPSVAGIAADFTGDGRPDWLCDCTDGSLMLYAGEPGRSFAAKPVRIPLTAAPVKQPSCLTAGDIDHDGDLDVFFGQWRSLYEKMPDKFWDSNDGYGNTFLINEGGGRFRDATEEAGLGAKRNRRTYSASFFDADGDHDADLLVVSDFSGPDLWINDGTGKFRDTTDAALPNRHTFGMSHTFADLNMDGLADIVAFGMGSTTARRLDAMKAAPGGYEETNRMRGAMGYGNRTFLATGDGTYRTPEFADAISRTGWTWGATSLDFDNDGDPDLYAGNGHISGTTTRDYCSNFWCRDIYLMPKVKTPDIQKYLDAVPAATSQSWDGYQVNALLINEAGHDFRDTAWLLGAGYNFDTRRVMRADLDADGLVDLLVERIEGTSGFQHIPSEKHEPPALVVLQNTGSEWKANQWIGVHLNGSTTCAPWGATVVLELASGRQQAAVIATGDSFMCQQPASAHFGLGNGADAPASLTIHWPDGKTSVLEKPAAGKYHIARPG